jgi:DNA-binding beta-propeller fold protein YncE
MEAPMHQVRIVIRLGGALGAFVVAVSLAAAQSAAPARLLVLLRDASALALVDPAGGKVLGQVPTAKDPHEVTASADGKLAFVGSPSGGISVIDLAARKELRRLDIGPRSEPHDVRVAGGKLYFTAEGYKMIGRYDPAADKIDWLLGTGQDSTHMLVLTKDMNTIFTANRLSNSVSMIEGVSSGPPKWKITAIGVPGKMPEGIDLSPDGREVWTATRGDGGVSIIDVVSKKVAHTFNLQLKGGNRLKFTPDGRLVLISDPDGGELVVVDAATRKERKRLKLAPDAILMSADSSRAYLGLRQDHSVAVIDLKTLEETSRFSTGPGSGPGCMAWAETR